MAVPAQIGWIFSDSSTSAGSRVYCPVALLRQLGPGSTRQAIIATTLHDTLLRIPVRLEGWSDHRLADPRVELRQVCAGVPASPGLEAAGGYWIAVGASTALALRLGNEIMSVTLLPITQMALALESLELRPRGRSPFAKDTKVMARILSGEIVSGSSVVGVPWIGGKGATLSSGIVHQPGWFFDVTGINGQSEGKADRTLLYEVTQHTAVHIVDQSVVSGEKVEGPRLGRAEWAQRVGREFGGFDREIQRLVQLASTSLLETAHFERAGLLPPKGCLLVGQPGCGKSALAHSVAKHSGLAYSVLSGPEVFQKNQGESEALLRETFEGLVERNAPCFLIIDEIDILAGVVNEERPIEARLTSHLMSLIDSLFTPRLSPDPLAASAPIQIDRRIFVIGLTNRPEQLDPALVRSGRLDHTITLGTKSARERRVILEICTRNIPIQEAENLSKDSILWKVAEFTSGYVGADLLNLCREAAMVRLSQKAEGSVSLGDFTVALSRTRPSILRDNSEIKTSLKPERKSEATEGRSKEFEQLGGLDDVIRELRASVLLPFQQPELYKRLKISPPCGILLAGPPGTGKTHLAAALASASSFNAVFLDPGQIRSKVVGESEAGLARIFRQAREASPCFLVIDQLELIAPKRDSLYASSGGDGPGSRLLGLLLTEMDGIFGNGTRLAPLESRVIVVGTTSQPQQIDPAILRPGRLDTIVKIPLPSESSRREIFRVHLQALPISPQSSGMSYEALLSELARLTPGKSGAEIENLCREAAMRALRSDILITAIEGQILLDVVLHGYE